MYNILRDEELILLAVFGLATSTLATVVDSTPWQFGLGLLALLTFIILVWGVVQRLRRWKKLRNPLVVRHFIPKRNYKMRIFPDARSDEQFPDKLVMGIGKYRVMQLLKPKVELTVDSVVLRFDGPSENQPQSEGRDNPYIVRRLPGDQIMDFHGDTQPDFTGKWPRQYHEGIPVMIGNGIETFGEWEGNILLEILIQGAKFVTYKLPLRVSREQDDMIPFLKGWSNDTGTE